MHDSSACGAVNTDCLKCPKAVDNLILHASHSRGFHFVMPRCDDNIIIFLLKGEVLINSKEYAGVTLHAGEFLLQAIGSSFESRTANLRYAVGNFDKCQSCTIS